MLLEDAASRPRRDAIPVLAPRPQYPHTRLTKLVGGAHQRTSATRVRPAVFEGGRRLIPFRTNTQIEARARRPTKRTAPPRPSTAPPCPHFWRTVGGRASHAGTAARTVGQAPLRSTRQGAMLEVQLTRRTFPRTPRLSHNFGMPYPPPSPFCSGMVPVCAAASRSISSRSQAWGRSLLTFPPSRGAAGGRIWRNSRIRVRGSHRNGPPYR